MEVYPEKEEKKEKVVARGYLKDANKLCSAYIKITTNLTIT